MFIHIDHSTSASVISAVCAGQHLAYPDGGVCPEAMYNAMMCPCWRASEELRPNFDWIMCKLNEEALRRKIVLDI